MTNYPDTGVTDKLAPVSPKRLEDLMKTKILSRLSKALFEEYNKLTEEETTALDKECKAVTTTNCGWPEYGIAKMFEVSVAAHINNRSLDTPVSERKI